MSRLEIRRPETIRVRFVLRPNNSLSWNGSMIFFISLCAASGSIAVGLGLLGFWIILPFAGLELLAVGSGLYVVSRRCQLCEVIDITDSTVYIERGYSAPSQRRALTRHWIQVVLKPCARDWYPSRLLLSAHGRGVEVGRFLSEVERQQLAAELRRTLRPLELEAVA